MVLKQGSSDTESLYELIVAEGLKDSSATEVEIKGSVSISYRNYQRNWLPDYVW